MAQGGVLYKGGGASGAYKLTSPGTSGQVLTSNGPSADPTFQNAGVGVSEVVRVVFDGGGSELVDNSKVRFSLPYAGTITKNRMLADQSGSAVLDIWKDTYANYPPTIADTITASAKPTISTATKSEDTTLTGWTTSVTAGDTFVVNVDSCTTITWLALELTVRRS